MLEFAQKGINAEVIKEAIVRSLKPYFRNKAVFDGVMDQMVGGWVNFELFKRENWHFDKFEKCLNLFNNALKENEQKCISAIVVWLPEITQCISRFWSFLNLEIDKKELEIDEYLEENLKNIGQFLEGIVKTYLKLVVQVNRIRLNIPVNLNKIKLMGLGVLIDELINKTDFPELFQPAPWNLRLNQWRNIAYHHSAIVENGKIKCWYKKKNQTVIFYLSREELLEVTRSIVNIYNVFKNIEFIFVFDNLKEIQKEVSIRNLDYRIRDEGVFIELYASITAQGFKIIEMSTDGDVAKLIVQELLNDQDICQRAIHTSQFLYSLWVYSNLEKIVIEYRLKNGSPCFESSTSNKICEKIARGKEELTYLAKNFEFKKYQDFKIR